MKPTPEQIADLAREAHHELVTIDYPGHIAPLDPWTMRLCERLVHLALERFGAGGGEPVARLMKYVGKVTYPKKGYTVARTYEECPKAAYPNDWEEGAELYTNPSPTDLRAEYLRGLEDAARVCDEVSLQANAAWKLAYKPQDQGRETGADECADAIRALKGKQ